MARIKKTRNIQDTMPMRKTEQSRHAKDLKKDSSFNKTKHRKKGLTAGSRYNIGQNKSSEIHHKDNANKNPNPNPNLKHGSKVKIDLLVKKDQSTQFYGIADDLFVNENKKEQLKQELLEIENDDYLNLLLDSLDEGTQLSKEEQEFVDKKTNRYSDIVALLKEYKKI